MSFNVLSGSITALNLVASGSFSGSFRGNGQDLQNVKQFVLQNTADEAIPFYKFTGGQPTTLNSNSNFNFNPTTTVLSSPKLKLTSIIAGTATTSSYLALDSSNNVVLTSSAGGSGGGGGGTIGAAEDGDYTDGLYTDFTTSTPVGTAIDRFNEVLKILAPTPAPSLSRINYDSGAGIEAQLAFGASSVVSGYTSSATAAGFDAVDKTGSYGPLTSGNNERVGILDGTQDVTGFLNFNTVQSLSNGQVAFSDDAFANSNEGTLKLELNGITIHSVALSGLSGSGDPTSGTANSLTSNSGFTNVSISKSSFDGNGAEWYIFKYRTAKYKVDSADMKVGWNYARVVHTVGSTDNATNFVEWINDPSGSVNDLAAVNGRIENITLAGSKYLSGVRYNTNATANYKVDLQNMYRNVFTTSSTPISFTVTNSSTPASIAVPNLGVSDDNTSLVRVTASLNVNASVNNLLSGAITANVSATHPLKNSISNVGSATTNNGFLIDNRTLASTNLIEYFHDESYRRISGSFDTQASAVHSSNVWNSQNHMTGGGAAGHTDGLLFYNQRLYSPVDADIPNNGNFSILSNTEIGQPDYSGVSGIRTFYRYLQNTEGSAIRDLKITSTKSGTSYDNSSLGTGNVHFFVKVPESTGWMDISQNFVYGNIQDGDGALISGASNNANLHHISFGTASVAASGYVVLKIVADESWTGYLSQLQFQLGASSTTATEAPQLDDIDANQSGVNAKLSFGSSNGIPTYSNVSGGGLGAMSTIDSNGQYTLSGDRRGIFNSFGTIGGELNEDVTRSPSSGGNAGKHYSNNAFKDAFTGSLVLEVNGAEVHTTNLETLSGITNSYNGNSSGFNLSPVSFSNTTDSIPDYTKPFRTGSYQVGAGEQRNGWNYARVIHRTATDLTTNYVEWVVDVSGSTDDTAVTSPTLLDFNHTSVYYQSGIGYFAARPTSSFNYIASNFYRNVYYDGSDAITFGTTTNSSITNIRISGSGITTFNSAVSQTSMPALNNSADCELTNIQVSGTVLFDSLTSISGGLSLFTDYDVSVASTIKHVSGFKSNRTTSTATKTSFMVYSGVIGSTNLNTNEYFNTETYRIVSGSYPSQSDTTSSLNSWNSQNSMNDAGSYPKYADGAVTINGYMISPLQIGNKGDTRNSADGGDLQAPAGNPNYSSGGLSENVRTFYRYFRNNSGLAKATFTLTLYGDANLISKSGAFYTGTLGANKNIQVELKVPFDPAFTGLDDTSTAWGDCIKPYSVGTQPDTDGVGIFNGGGSDLNQTVDGSGRAIAIQLQGKQVRDDQYFIVKISAHKDWAGYLSRIQITY